MAAPARYGQVCQRDCNRTEPCIAIHCVEEKLRLAPVISNVTPKEPTVLKNDLV